MPSFVRFGRWRAMLRLRPEPALVRARGSGERVIAVNRLVVAVLISAVAGLLSPTRIGLVLAAAVVSYSLIVVWVAFRTSAPALPWLTTAIDATAVTAALSVFVIYEAPTLFLTNRLLFEAYFFVLANSVLRFDWRLAAFAIALILVEYLGLTALVGVRWGFRNLPTETVAFAPTFFALRVLLLAVTGTSGIVVASWALHLRLLIGTDQLTGLPQRRPFLERIDEELQRAKSGGGTLTLALLDVDDFKRFNDTHGHVAGDNALRTLADVLKASVRTTDLLSRYGGEEFLVAFPRAHAAQALRRAEQIRAGLAETDLRTPSGAARLTVSIGVASWPEDGPTYEAVYAKADERLYAAKGLGKNQVVGPPNIGRVINLRES